MTRWARGSDANRKKAHEGTSWKDLKDKSKHREKPFGTSRELNRKDQRQKNSTYKQKAKYFYKEGQWQTSSKTEDIDDSELLVKLKRPDDSDTKPKGIAAELEDLKKLADLSAVDEQEISEMVHKEQRREKRRLKRIHERQSGKTCFNCREMGHDMVNCPELEGSQDQGTGICFKCGSTEHSMGKCRVKVPPGQYPYAKCFICGEQGHLSKQCGDNPRGLYPYGGCCRVCGSVEHYKKDCPESQQKQGIEPMALHTFDTCHHSLDAETTTTVARGTHKPVKKKGPKVINF